MAHKVHTVVLYYDHLLTFGSEIERFWGTPLSLGNILFFLNRYFTFTVSLVLVAIRKKIATDEVMR
jgi:hypothetical protein